MLKLTLALALGFFMTGSGRAEPPSAWVTAWAASAQGPYPIGNASMQPDLRRVFPSPDEGAKDLSFRLIVEPEIWGERARLRFSNAFGTLAVTFDSVFVGLHLNSSAVVAGTNVRVSFGSADSVTVEPGESIWSDPIELPFADPAFARDLHSRRLAVSFHIAGQSGPMTWHAKGLTTSYISWPGAGAVSGNEDEAAFPFGTTSWYFLDALDMRVAEGAKLVVALGDSITDGTSSTLNGDDRWPDVLSRRLHAAYGNRYSVVNAGIGGNQVIGPSDYTAVHPFPGGPAATQRLTRDVASLSGVSAIIWLEGINDFSKNGNARVEDVVQAFRDGVSVLRHSIPGVKIIGGTVTSALNNAGPAHGFAEQDQKRRALNDFIRAGGLFDGVADFDQATADPGTGELRAEFVPDSTAGGPGDKLHPNRLGYLAMGSCIDLALLPRPVPHQP